MLKRRNYMITEHLEAIIKQISEEQGVSRSEVVRHLLTSGARVHGQSQHWDGIGKKHGAFVASVQSVPIFYGPPDATDAAIAEYETMLLAEQAIVRTGIKQNLSALPAINDAEAEAMADTARMPRMTRVNQ